MTHEQSGSPTRVGASIKGHNEGGFSPEAWNWLRTPIATFAKL